MASDIINLPIIILLLMHSICARPRNKKSLRWSSPPSKNSILISISADFFLPHVQRLLITEHCFTSLRQPTASRGKSGKFHFVRRKNDFMLKLIIIRNSSGRREKNTKIREKQILCNWGGESLAANKPIKVVDQILGEKWDHDLSLMITDGKLRWFWGFPQSIYIMRFWLKYSWEHAVMWVIWNRRKCVRMPVGIETCLQS